MAILSERLYGLIPFGSNHQMRLLWVFVIVRLNRAGCLGSATAALIYNARDPGNVTVSPPIESKTSIDNGRFTLLRLRWVPSISGY